MKKKILTDTSPEPNVVHTDSVAPRKRKRVLDIVIIVLVIGIIGGVWWFGHRLKPEPKSTYPQYNQQQLLEEITKKYGQHDYNGAINLIKGQKIVNEPPVQRYLAGAYANAGDNKRAVEVYDKLDAQGKINDSDIYATAAEVAGRDKQYQKAINYYKKAKEALKNSEAAVDQGAVYDYKIADLEKKL